MRVAIVSDVHGNLAALEAVIADIKQSAPDIVVHGGDLVHGGARPAEVVDRIRSLGWLGVCGNTDEMLWAPEGLRAFACGLPALNEMFAAIEEMIPPTCEQLGTDRIDWLKTMPYVHQIGRIAIVHAQPNDLWRAPGAKASDTLLQEAYGELGAPIVVYGHIHESYVRNLPAMTVANSGSVSLSHDGDTRASYFAGAGRESRDSASGVRSG